MKAVIKQGALRGFVKAPPSKSIVHRLLICGGLSGEGSVIKNVSSSEDILATIDCLKALGANASWEGDSIFVSGVGNTGVKNSDDMPVFNCRESGSTLRFFIPIALSFFEKVLFTGSNRLLERGIGIYEDVFSKKGITVQKTSEGLEFTGMLTPGDYEIPGNVSSQYITGLLYALPLLNDNSRIKIIPPLESGRYIDLTLSALKRSGIVIEKTAEYEYFIKGGQKYNAINEEAEGDWSNAAFWYALKYLGNDITVTGLNAESAQGDRVCIENFEKLLKPGATVDVSECIDLAPVLFAFAAARHGGRFTGTKRLSIKESDRAAVMKEELEKFGIETLLSENEAVITGSGLKNPAVPLYGHNDHRIVMALSVLLSLTGGEIEGVEAVRKSYPDFFEKFRELSGNVEINE